MDVYSCSREFVINHCSSNSAEAIKNRYLENRLYIILSKLIVAVYILFLVEALLKRVRE